MGVSSVFERQRGNRRQAYPISFSALESCRESTHVEDAQEEHQERRTPPCLEAYGDHSASGQTKDRDDDPDDGPFTIEHEAEEEEDEQYSSSEL